MDIKINFNNLEELEINLVELGHDMAMTENEQFQQTLGRCLKHMAPAFIQFLSAEHKRNEEHGPGYAVTACVKNYAFLTFLLLSAAAKTPDHLKKGSESVIKLFSECFKDFTDTSTTEKPYDPVWNETVH